MQGCDSASEDPAPVTEDPEDGVTQVTREVVDCGDHSALMLAGLDRLRQSGLLLDTLLWAEGVSFQVSEEKIRELVSDNL